MIFLTPLTLHAAPQKSAAYIKDLSQFAQLPVLDEGRIKPLDTYARSLLVQFSGKTSLQKEPALHWLARLLFDPDSTLNDQVFLINSPEIPMALGIEKAQHRRYSYAQLEPGLQKLQELAQATEAIEQKNRSIVEAEIVRLYQNVKIYTELSRAFMFTKRHKDFQVTDATLHDELALPSADQTFSFLDIALRAGRIVSVSQEFENKPQNTWSLRDRELLALMHNLFMWTSVYQNLPPAIMPSRQPDDEQWFSPWDSMREALPDPQGQQELKALAQLPETFIGGQSIQFNLALKQIRELTGKRISGKQNRQIKNIPLEVLYNQLNPFGWAKLSYFLVLMIFLFSLIKDFAQFNPITWTGCLIGFGFNILGIMMRVTILHRPPVSNLYETFVFVALICGATGLIVERFTRSRLGFVISSCAGFIFLTIAGRFALEGDTLKMLVAVLNSNFWLSTHVLSITTGYSGCCVAGIVGHLYLIQKLTGVPAEKVDATYRILIGTLGFGLTMTFLGTNLGGIWADQSWGRFWGWDPKENGALLIVLWTALTFHARIAKLIGPVGVAAASVFGIIVVMWAWFGVNLLSIGLHSYGFTSGAAVSLGIYVAVELAFLGISTGILKRKQRST